MLGVWYLGGTQTILVEGILDVALGPRGAKVNKAGSSLGDLTVWSERQTVSNQRIVLYACVRYPFGHSRGHDYFARRLGRHGGGDSELGAPFHQYCRPSHSLHMPRRAGQVSPRVFIK